MTLYQLENGYRYNSDSLFLYDFISKNKLFGDLLDVGCGSGILGLLLKRDFSDLSLTSLDIQEINRDITKFNADENGLKVSAICEDISKFKSENKFDFIVSNPPFYIDEVTKSGNEHINISRYSGNLKFDDLLKSVNSLLKPRGVFYFCYDARRLGEVVSGLAGFKLNLTRFRLVYSKISKESKLALFEAKKSSKSMTKIEPPLIVFDEFGYSKEAKMVFDKANTQSRIFVCK